MKRDFVDVFHVERHHEAIHARLLNWAAWVSVRPHYATSPMFQALGVRSNSRQWHAPDIRDTVDTLDALKLEKTMRHLPEKNRAALQWHYLYPFILPWRACRFLGVSQEGLRKLVVNARQMVDNNLGCV